MSGEGGGMNVERDMAGLVEDFEHQKHYSIEKILQSLTHDSLYAPGSRTTLEDVAKDPRSLTANIIRDHYPDILDRELLAGALDKKYLDREESEYPKKIDELEAENKAAIEQGHAPAEYTSLVERKSEIADLVLFLSLMNQTEDEAMQKQWEKEARAAEHERQIQIDRETALKKFEEYEIAVPTREDPNVHKNLSLGKYIDGVATLAASGNISKEEYQTRVDHIKANFQFAFEPQIRWYIGEKYQEECKAARQEAEKWQSEAILHELSDEDKIAARKALKALLKADSALQIVREILS